MKAKDTVLVGCEVLCLPFEGSDYVDCPLPLEEQKVCRQRLQYQAGLKEVVEWVEEHNWKRTTTREEWQAQLKVWGVGRLAKPCLTPSM